MKTKSFINNIYDKKVLMEAFCGSQAYGLYQPQNGASDIDMVSCYRYPFKYYFTLYGYEKRKESDQYQNGDLDVKEHEVRKMFKLLQQVNPSFIECLYYRPEDYVRVSTEWEMVVNNRHVFLSKNRIRDGFGGYAHDQLTKLTNGSNKNYRGRLGEKRKKLVEKYGYDTKNAMHLIRLLKMGTEFLRDGELQVYREHDADFLLSIKRGEQKLEDVQDLSTKLFIELDRAYEQSLLPEHNNEAAINKLLFDVLTYV